MLAHDLTPGECFRRLGRPYMLLERAGERYLCGTPKGENVILLPDRADVPGEPLPLMGRARVTLMAQAEFLELEQYETYLKNATNEVREMRASDEGGSDWMDEK